jgi:biotin carboxylase
MPFIRAAKRLGFSTIVFDLNKNCPASNIADCFYNISTHNYTKIIKKCEQIKNKMKIVGVMTYCSDIEPLLTVAKLNSILRLPGFSSEVVKILNNKIEMKKCFVENELPTPDWVITSVDDEFESFFTNCNDGVIVKPSLGSQGSKGVFLLKNKNDFFEKSNIAKNISKNNEILMEQFIIGEEFSVDGIVIGKNPVILSVSRKHNLGASQNFIMSGFSTGLSPNNNTIAKTYYSELKIISKKAIRDIGLTNSFFSLDILLTKNGPYILECGMLLDCKIDRLLKFANIDCYSLFLKMLTEKGFTYEAPHFIGGYALSFIYSDVKGILSKINNNAFDEDVLLEWEKIVGEKINIPSSVSDCIGWITAKSKNSDNAYDLAKRLSLSQLFSIE